MRPFATRASASSRYNASQTPCPSLKSKRQRPIQSIRTICRTCCSNSRASSAYSLCRLSSISVTSHALLKCSPFDTPIPSTAMTRGLSSHIKDAVAFADVGSGCWFRRAMRGHVPIAIAAAGRKNEAVRPNCRNRRELSWACGVIVTETRWYGWASLR